ncbi:phosphatase PAP2 family protein [Haloechinothrix sp. YIM 98757]|uniref:Phosphatase PAP2 family protein n=1 Tax=Haloechinothrix aidingensis TaxID=2752311 RepID=A0A838A5Q3_9PSEU|nr:phosphatase PAP2 family protein [Haloechinothrix aidingensis]MBA0125100.1 phosphatase PAP2 family protein [Haloechinothrix aidingensis]
MNALWEAEIDLVTWIQGWGDWLQGPMTAVSALGSEVLYLGLAPLVFWSVSASIGARLYVLLIASATVNIVLKSLVGGPRPYWFSSQVTRMTAESSFGAPSGHAQMSTTLWGYLAAKIRRRWAWVAAIILVVAVSVTRLYLGVHFLSDILAGMLIGVLAVWCALRYEDRLLRWWHRWPVPGQLAIALGISLVAPLISAVWQATVRADWSTPDSWTGAVPADPEAGGMSTVLQASGALLGLLCGLSLLWARGWYSAAGSVRSRIARGVLGVLGMVAVVVVLRVAVPDPGGILGHARDFVLAALTMIWGFWLIPELFIRVKLAARPTPAGGSARAR